MCTLAVYEPTKKRLAAILLGRACFPTSILGRCRISRHMRPFEAILVGGTNVAD